MGPFRARAMASVRVRSWEVSRPEPQAVQCYARSAELRAKVRVQVRLRVQDQGPAYGEVQP